jgi:GMP synthase-like glutamine amidotransferase
MILLIQFRTDQSGWHEVKCIFEGMQIPYNQYLILNAGSPFLTAEEIIEIASKADAVLLGGMGEGGFEETNPFKKNDFDIMRNKMEIVINHLVNIGKPMLGTCFGHQLLIDVLGGKIDKAQSETGITTITLNEEGIKDPIFEGMGENFQAIVGHKSSVVAIPENVTVLASSAICQVQAFRYNHASKIYGFQFHPEMNVQDLDYRMTLYPEYAQNSLDYDPNQQLTVKQILKNFLKITKD